MVLNIIATSKSMYIRFQNLVEVQQLDINYIKYILLQN